MSLCGCILLRFIGPKAEAEEIKRELGQFLKDTLHLELSETKTLVMRARTEQARFLGYHIHTLHEDTQRDIRNYRTLNGRIGLRVPEDVVEQHCRRLMSHGKVRHRPELLFNSDFSLVSEYQVEYRGVVNDYRFAYNLTSLNKWKGVMQYSLVKTLANKFQIPVSCVYRKYRATLEVDGVSYQGLQVIREREGKRPLVAAWGGISLKWSIHAQLTDQPRRLWNGRSKLEQRLLAQVCELCGSTDQIEVHHVRALKDLQKYPGRAKPLWVTRMAARHRKTLVLCRSCHDHVHAGRPLRHTSSRSPD